MPLLRFGNCKTKVCRNNVVSKNISELTRNGTRKRTKSQIVAIAYAGAAKKGKK